MTGIFSIVMACHQLYRAKHHFDILPIGQIFHIISALCTVISRITADVALNGMLFGLVLCNGAYGTKMEFVYSTLILGVVSIAEKVLIELINNGQFLIISYYRFEKNASGYTLDSKFLPTSVKMYDAMSLLLKIPLVKPLLMKIPIKKVRNLVSKKLENLGENIYSFQPNEESRHTYRRRFVLNLCKYSTFLTKQRKEFKIL